MRYAVCYVTKRRKLPLVFQVTINFSLEFFDSLLVFQWLSCFPKLAEPSVYSVSVREHSEAKIEISQRGENRLLSWKNALNPIHDFTCALQVILRLVEIDQFI